MGTRSTTTQLTPTNGQAPRQPHRRHRNLHRRPRHPPHRLRPLHGMALARRSGRSHPVDRRLHHPTLRSRRSPRSSAWQTSSKPPTATALMATCSTVNATPHTNPYLIPNPLSPRHVSPHVARRCFPLHPTRPSPAVYNASRIRPVLRSTETTSSLPALRFRCASSPSRYVANVKAPPVATHPKCLRPPKTRRHSRNSQRNGCTICSSRTICCRPAPSFFSASGSPSFHPGLHPLRNSTASTTMRVQSSQRGAIRKASEFGLHEYGNRDWAGLPALATTTCPAGRCTLTPSPTLSSPASRPKPSTGTPLATTGTTAKRSMMSSPRGDSYTAASAIARSLNLLPNQSTPKK